MVDKLLILTFRIFAHGSSEDSSDWSKPISQGSIDDLMAQFYIDRGIITNKANKVVLYTSLNADDMKYLMSKGVKH